MLRLLLTNVISTFGDEVVMMGRGAKILYIETSVSDYHVECDDSKCWRMPPPPGTTDDTDFGNLTTSSGDR